jgi:hypothetical protein
LRGPKRRKLDEAEIKAIRARPWPRLPAWLWLAAGLSTLAMIALAAALVLRPGPADVTVPLGARRSPPADGLSHGVGAWRAPALERPTAGRAEVARGDCPRMSRVVVTGTDGDVRLLQEAVGKVCALRSEGGIDQARAALDRTAVVIAFAGFTATGNESTMLLAPYLVPRPLDLRGGSVAVLVNGKFAGGAPERIAALLIHEGAHLAAQGAQPPTAEGELAARRTELAACNRLFPADGGLRPSRGCQDAKALVDLGEVRALAELRAAGYR